MELKQLRHVQSAARHSSYARAAAECFTSRQNIAHSVKMLESENRRRNFRDGILVVLGIVVALLLLGFLFASLGIEPKGRLPWAP